MGGGWGDSEEAAGRSYSRLWDVADEAVNRMAEGEGLRQGAFWDCGVLPPWGAAEGPVQKCGRGRTPGSTEKTVSRIGCT